MLDGNHFTDFERQSSLANATPIFTASASSIDSTMKARRVKLHSPVGLFVIRIASLAACGKEGALSAKRVRGPLASPSNTAAG
jgi:hypothetical protein